jgi:hypothetical protein
LAGKGFGGIHLERKYEISRPEFFTVELGDGKTCRGADQEWYQDEWQRKAGCGPTTAATLLAYLSATRPELSALNPSCSCCQADFLRFMEEVWEHVTPGKLGVNSLHLFSDGVKSLAREHHCAVHIRELDIPRFHLARPSFSQCAAFLRTGLSADCPIAFLNFSRGLVPHLDGTGSHYRHGGAARRPGDLYHTGRGQGAEDRFPALVSDFTYGRRSALYPDGE